MHGSLRVGRCLGLVGWRAFGWLGGEGGGGKKKESGWCFGGVRLFVCYFLVCLFVFFDFIWCGLAFVGETN